MGRFEPLAPLACDLAQHGIDEARAMPHQLDGGVHGCARRNPAEQQQLVGAEPQRRDLVEIAYVGRIRSAEADHAEQSNSGESGRAGNTDCGGRGAELHGGKKRREISTGRFAPDGTMANLAHSGRCTPNCVEEANRKATRKANSI